MFKKFKMVNKWAAVDSLTITRTVWYTLSLSVDFLQEY